MAHDDVYVDFGSNFYTESDWQSRYPAREFCYGILVKTTVADLYNEVNGDTWKKTEVRRYSFWNVLDWAYPTTNDWTNKWRNLYATSYRCRYDRIVEGDANSYPVREQFQTLTGKANTEYVCPPNDVTMGGNEYRLFPLDYEYDESELHYVDEHVKEVEKHDLYEASFLITVEHPLLWDMNNDYILVHQYLAEPKSNNGYVAPTSWQLDDDKKLIMGVYHTAINDVGAFLDCPYLTKISIPIATKSIGEYALTYTALSAVTIASDCNYYSTSFPQGCEINNYEEE